ncbi:MAG: hypothetical protein KGV50_05560 [Gammaproteobacteria bacterium]|nr:hypothetical protein [Gammaproteobacteria bacterium]
MKILLLVNEANEKAHADFFSGLHREIGSVDLRRLSPIEQTKLKLYFSKNIDVTRYDRIVFSIDFDNLRKNVKFIQSLSRLVFLDFDNHFEALRDEGKDKYFDFYKRVPWARIILTSNMVAKKYNQAGLNSIFIARGFSLNGAVSSLPQRKITKELHQKREDFLSCIALKNMPLTVTNDYAFAEVFGCVEKEKALFVGEELREYKLFIFPDIGFGEYDDKVFKAMSQGDIVFAFDQGRDENSALGFDNMQNIILFSSFEELEKKIASITSFPKQMLRIAKEGESLVKSKYQYYDLGVATAKEIAKKIRKAEDYKVGLTFFGFRV